MPYRYKHANSVCAEAGCWRIAVARGRCREHQLPRAPRVNARVIARLRRQLIAKYGERCAICGVTERLEVHHLDGNAMHNTLANVELRCLPHNPRGADTTRLAAKYQREPAMRAELAERYRMGGYP